MYDSLKYTTYIWPPLSLLLKIANTAPSDRQLPKAQPCSRHQQTNNEGTPHTLNPPQAKHLEHLNKTETDQNVWNEGNSKFVKIKPISSSRIYAPSLSNLLQTQSHHIGSHWPNHKFTEPLNSSKSSTSLQDPFFYQTELPPTPWAPSPIQLPSPFKVSFPSGKY